MKSKIVYNMLNNERMFVVDIKEKEGQPTKYLCSYRTDSGYVKSLFDEGELSLKKVNI